MKKPFIIAGITTIIILIGGVFLLSKEAPSKNYPNPANPVFYWGEGCPHCLNVENFMATWEKKDQIVIEKKEVWQNSDNAEEMQARFDTCNIPPTEMGVPLLFTPDGKCLTGDVPIIDYLKTL